ncbi:hypothetical protein GGR52DRAFT_540786 [Hypoxylon sp. FL1284]|nr:hypothetical protein GGR52DRAFT_540786 [Hypoxylon sp. FL1284]
MISPFALILLSLTLLASITSGYTYVGCYAPPTDLEYNVRFIYQSVGYCRRRCTLANQPILGVTNGTDCLCGASLPSADSLVADTMCDSPCAGYAAQNCGGLGYFSVYLIPEPETSTHQTEQASTSIKLPQALC